MLQIIVLKKNKKRQVLQYGYNARNFLFLRRKRVNKNLPCIQEIFILKKEIQVHVEIATILVNINVSMCCTFIKRWAEYYTCKESEV